MKAINTGYICGTEPYITEYGTILILTFYLTFSNTLKMPIYDPNPMHANTSGLSVVTVINN